MHDMESAIKGVSLVCPYCEQHPAVVYDNERDCLVCQACSREYKKKAGIPCFLDEDHTKLDLVWGSSNTVSVAKKVWNILVRLKAPRVKIRNLPHVDLLAALAKKETFKALYLGYNQPFDDTLSENIIQLEINPKEFTDVIAMGEYVPFPDRSFDLVVISGVIEHTMYPDKVVEQSYRILHQGGKLYLSSPWVYPFHGGDNYRYSHQGLCILLHQYENIEIGSLNGPLHALGIFLHHLMINSLSFNNKYIRYGLSIVTSWLVFPLMLVDAVINRQKKQNYMLDANIFAIATK